MSMKFSYIYQFAAKVSVDTYFKISNLFGKKRGSLYIYTDSRGFYVNKWYCKKNPLFSYLQILSKDYHIDYKLCDYKHTTLIDFLCDYENKIKSKKYDAIILHLGVVDFSPRTVAQANEVLKIKKRRLVKTFNLYDVKNIVVNEYLEEYEGERTASLYTEEFFKNFIIDKINKIDQNIIWIGVNKVLSDWNGNYEKNRPSNINNIIKYQNVIDNSFNGKIISLSSLSDQDIKKYTVDNIHLSLDGFSYIAKKIYDVMGENKTN